MRWKHKADTTQIQLSSTCFLLKTSLSIQFSYNSLTGDFRRPNMQRIR